MRILKLSLIPLSATAIGTGLTACGDDSPDEHAVPDADSAEAGAPTDDDADDDAHDDDAHNDDAHDDEIPDAHEIPTDASAGAVMCAELASNCHALDTGDGELGDRCHDIGHLGDEAACAEVYEQCIAFCQQPADGGDHADDDHADDDHAGSDPLCVELGEVCHDFDDGDGLGRQCHEVGHTGDAEECAAIYDECVAFCEEPADGGLDAGHDHVDSDGGDAGSQSDGSVEPH